MTTGRPPTVDTLSPEDEQALRHFLATVQGPVQPRAVPKGATERAEFDGEAKRIHLEALSWAFSDEPDDLLSETMIDQANANPAVAALYAYDYARAQAVAQLADLTRQLALAKRARARAERLRRDDGATTRLRRKLAGV